MLGQLEGRYTRVVDDRGNESSGSEVGTTRVDVSAETTCPQGRPSDGPHPAPSAAAFADARRDLRGSRRRLRLLRSDPSGATLRQSSFRASWRPARESVGLPELRFHDLRQTGNTLAAATGASTKELMARMGHATMSAALIYQHATADRDQAIAKALCDLAAQVEVGRADVSPAATGRARPRATGTQRARGDHLASSKRGRDCGSWR